MQSFNQSSLYHPHTAVQIINFRLWAHHFFFATKYNLSISVETIKNLFVFFQRDSCSWHNMQKTSAPRFTICDVIHSMMNQSISDSHFVLLFNHLEFWFWFPFFLSETETRITLFFCMCTFLAIMGAFHEKNNRHNWRRRYEYASPELNLIVATVQLGYI